MSLVPENFTLATPYLSMSSCASLSEASWLCIMVGNIRFPCFLPIFCLNASMFWTISSANLKLSSLTLLCGKLSTVSFNPAKLTMPEQFSSLKYASPVLLWVRNGRQFLACCLSVLCLISKARVASSKRSFRISKNLFGSFSLSWTIRGRLMVTVPMQPVRMVSVSQSPVRSVSNLHPVLEKAVFFSSFCAMLAKYTIPFSEAKL